MKTELEFTNICPRRSDLGPMALDHSQRQVFAALRSLVSIVSCLLLYSVHPWEMASQAIPGWPYNGWTCEHQSRGTSPLNPVLLKLAPLDQAGPDVSLGHFVKLVAVSLALVCYKATRLWTVAAPALQLSLQKSGPSFHEEMGELC